MALALSFLTFECWPIGQNLGISKSRSSGFPRERRTTDLNSTGPACSISAVGRSLGNLQPRGTRPTLYPLGHKKLPVLASNGNKAARFSSSGVVSSVFSIEQTCPT